MSDSSEWDPIYLFFIKSKLQIVHFLSPSEKLSLTAQTLNLDGMSWTGYFNNEHVCMCVCVGIKTNLKMVECHARLKLLPATHLRSRAAS